MNPGPRPARLLQQAGIEKPRRLPDTIPMEG